MFKVLKYLLLILTAPIWVPLVAAFVFLIGLAIYLLGYFVVFVTGAWIFFMLFYTGAIPT